MTNREKSGAPFSIARLGINIRSLRAFWWFCAVALALSVSASAEKFRSPWGAKVISPVDAPYSCPAPPAFSQSLQTEGYYIDKQYSVVDPKRLAEFNKATEGPTHLGQFASKAADEWQTKGNRAAAACVYSLLSAAAQEGAWAGTMPQNNGVYLQNWMLSGTAIAYLKVRNSGTGTPAQDAKIEKWFKLVASRVMDYFNVSRDRPGSDAWNNHMYWAGLAVAAAGIAANDKGDLKWGIDAYKIGIDAIQPDGSLVAEMARGQMALHYQIYALGALVMLAELGEANGVQMYAMKNGAIHKLVKFNAAAMKDPTSLEKRAGAKQSISAIYSGLEIGWAVPYVRRFPDPQLSKWIAQAPWVAFWQWGGAPLEP